MTYWEKRQQQLNKQLEKDEAKLKKRLSSFYDAEFRKLEKQIAAYYTQFGEDNVIQYRTLMERLSAEDQRLFMEQMDAFVKKYPEYAHLMPVRDSIYRLNRLEGLQHSILMQQYEIGATNIEQITDHLNRQALQAANAAAEALGFGKNFYAINADIIRKFVDVPWADGKNFSTRIWGNTEKLANYLNTDIAQAFARGDSYDRIVSNLKKRFDKVARNDAYRLVYTEGTYVMAEATMTPFESEFEQYRVSTVGDGKVCDICREVAKETFQIKDRAPGVNFPPLHAWCRCSFTIEVNDWDAWMEDYERRHGNGRAEKVKDRLMTGKSSDTMDSWKRIVGEHPATDDVLQTNPHYREGREYQENCQRCVVAYEMRRRGYDVIAKPSILPLPKDRVAQKWLNFFEGSEFLFCKRGNGLEEVKQQMQNWGGGARAQIYVLIKQRDNKERAHVFIAEQRGWITEFYDPQSGNVNSENIFNKVTHGKTMICRIDNLELGDLDLLKECVEVVE